jgi:hypothetical protein
MGHNAKSDHALFLSHLAKSEPVIRAYLRSLVQDYHDQSEIMQNVFITAWNKFSSFRGKLGNNYFGRSYLNGYFQFESKAQNTKYLEPGELIMGNIISTETNSGKWKRPISGLFDELIIWNRCLSAHEIKKLHKEGKPTHMNTLLSL